jgi:CDP-6-deoxy-D-xylo-4-hexulose-3-dehydrase
MRVIGDLTGADEIMNRTLIIGTSPGLTHEMLDYVIESIHEFACSEVAP